MNTDDSALLRVALCVVLLAIVINLYFFKDKDGQSEPLRFALIIISWGIAIAAIVVPVIVWVDIGNKDFRTKQDVVMGALVGVIFIKGLSLAILLLLRPILNAVAKNNGWKASLVKIQERLENPKIE